MSLVLRVILRVRAAATETSTVIEDGLALACRLVRAVQKGSDGGWEVAQVSLNRLRVPVGSMPDIQGVSALKALLPSAIQLGAASGELSSLYRLTAATTGFDLEQWLASCDWMDNQAALRTGDPVLESIFPT